VKRQASENAGFLYQSKKVSYCVVAIIIVEKA